MVFCKLVLLLIAFFAVMPQSALALTASQVYEQVKDSVVVIKAFDQKGQQVGLGSGVMLPSGDIITNYHVIKAGSRYMVSKGAKAITATLKSGDPDKDFCLLTAPGLTAKPVRLGKAAKLKVGAPVYAVGAPQGLELSLSEGIVSQLRGGPPPIIQTTVAVSPGSSGSGLFNGDGELVGITTFYLKEGQSLNFALPVEWITEVAGRKPRGFGERIPELPYQLAQRYTVQEMKEAAVKYADHYEIPRDMFLAYIGDASNWNPLAKNSETSACGLGKITDSTGKRLGLKITGRSDDERWDPGKNLDATARLFVQRYEKYGNWKKALLSIGEPTEEYHKRVKNRANQEMSFLLQRREQTSATPDPGLGPPEDWEERSRALFIEKNWQALASYCRRWTKAEPGNALAWYSFGVAYEEMGRYGESVDAYLEGLRLKPDDWGAWYSLGDTYGKMGRYSERVEAYRKALRLKPEISLGWYKLGVAYASMGNRAAALEAVRELRRYSPQRADELFNLIMKP